MNTYNSSSISFFAALRRVHDMLSVISDSEKIRSKLLSQTLFISTVVLLSHLTAQSFSHKQYIHSAGLIHRVSDTHLCSDISLYRNSLITLNVCFVHHISSSFLILSNCSSQLLRVTLKRLFYISIITRVCFFRT